MADAVQPGSSIPDTCGWTVHVDGRDIRIAAPDGASYLRASLDDDQAHWIDHVREFGGCLLYIGADLRDETGQFTTDRRSAAIENRRAAVGVATYRGHSSTRRWWQRRRT